MRDGQGDFGILSLDFSNAFNSLDRTAMLARIRAHAPAFDHCARQCYAVPSTLYGDGFTLSSTSGTQQGDVCGPRFFALTIQYLVQAIAGQAIYCNRWYLDDGFVAGPLSILSAVMSFLKSAGPLVGLVLNESKCKLWLPSFISTNDPQLLALPCITGSTFLGVPIGPKPYIEEFLQAFVVKFESALDRLPLLSHAQAATSILRSYI